MAVTGSDRAALQQARTAVDDVFALVREPALYERPIPERNRLIFYVGHVEAFDGNLLRHAMDVPATTPELDRLFAFGIDPEPGCLPDDQPKDWPSLTEVRRYCERVRNEIDTIWTEVPAQLRHVALEHRLMHAETLAYMLHNMPLDQLVSPAVFESVPTGGAAEPASTVDVAPGVVVLGRHCSEGFGWDNEFPRTDVEVDRFCIAERKTTNGEYLDFLQQAGGTPSHFWRQRNGRWYLRRMFDEVPLPLDWPVWVTHAQASEYCAWKGARLPTEPEWHRASEGTDFEGCNFDSRRYDPEPASCEPGAVNDLYGNGWEWTSTLFRPFPGFQPFSFYPGYSANFFDDDHYVLKGASPRTDGVFTRRSFRNWFRQDYPYVFASFRCAWTR
jgi:gamma-glutamyl hercynylcysteine S-oxide synthase